MSLQLLEEDKRIEVIDSALPDVTDGDPETVYTVRQIPPEVNRSLGKRHTTTPINRRTGQRETVVDHEALLDDLVDYAIVSWSGILLKGEPAPCTRENKLLLDFTRKTGLLSVAGLNQVNREDSFRRAP